MAPGLRLPDSELPGWLPQAALPLAVIVTLHAAEPWLFMWALAAAISAGFKWLTWWRSCASPSPSGGGSGRGWRGPWARIYVLAIAGLPAFWLFHPWFVLRVIVPFMRALGAI